MDVTREMRCPSTGSGVTVYACTLNYRHGVDKCADCSIGYLAAALLEIREDVDKLKWAKHKNDAHKKKRSQK